jgi:hypothetical protein
MAAKNETLFQKATLLEPKTYFYTHGLFTLLNFKGQFVSRTHQTTVDGCKKKETGLSKADNFTHTSLNLKEQ